MESIKFLILFMLQLSMSIAHPHHSAPLANLPSATYVYTAARPRSFFVNETNLLADPLQKQKWQGLPTAPNLKYTTTHDHLRKR